MVILFQFIAIFGLAISRYGHPSPQAIYIQDVYSHDIGPAEDLTSKYPHVDFTIQLDEKDIINTHGHVCMAALRNVADDKELNDGLMNRIFPLKGSLVIPNSISPNCRDIRYAGIKWGLRPMSIYIFIKRKCHHWCRRWG